MGLMRANLMWVSLGGPNFQFHVAPETRRAPPKIGSLPTEPNPTASAETLRHRTHFDLEIDREALPTPNPCGLNDLIEYSGPSASCRQRVASCWICSASCHLPAEPPALTEKCGGGESRSGEWILDTFHLLEAKATGLGFGRFTFSIGRGFTRSGAEIERLFLLHDGESSNRHFMERRVE
ncbi:hypothetical protein H6P81_009367 [Aristolochia fimbriata]|uniref:Uncharacterized protein n=1 Tax=Aristolochia fimbriata TaxID=158543 RepID=A0AAV7ENT2_ARIFI|nr:hypothetical protein H6P81_009367 [Aristolochia fimbriata]